MVTCLSVTHRDLSVEIAGTKQVLHRRNGGSPPLGGRLLGAAAAASGALEALPRAPGEAPGVGENPQGFTKKQIDVFL